MPIVAPVFAWIVSLLGSVVTSVATWLVGRMAFERAMHYALVTAFVVAAGGLFLGVTLSVKAAILGARVVMPQSLGIATFFLPASIGQIIGFIVTARVSVALYRWTVATMAAYLPITPRSMML